LTSTPTPLTFTTTTATATAPLVTPHCPKLIMAIKDKLSHVVEAVTDKVSSQSSHHNSVNTASKTPAAYPAGATHPPPGEKSVNGVIDKGSLKSAATGPLGAHKDHPGKTALGGSGKHDVSAQEHVENEMVGKHAGTKTVPVPTGKTVPVVPVVPVAAVKPVTTTPASAKVVDADAYAVASTKTTTVEGSTHPVGESDGLRDVKFYLSMGGEGHKMAVKGSWDGWKEEVDCSSGDGAVLHLKPGVYSYKYLLDGNWITDSSTETTTDSDGNVNNILTVV